VNGQNNLNVMIAREYRRVSSH